MKLSKLSLMLILIASGLALSDASADANGSQSQELVRNSSVSPPTSKKKQSEADKKTAATDSSPDSSPKPLVVIKNPAATIQEDGTSNETKRLSLSNLNWGSVPDWVFIFIATGAAWIALSTLRALQRKVEANRISADAAKESADLAREEFLSTHRPKIIVRRVSVNIARGTGIPDQLGIEFIVANIGDTRAKIIEMSARLWLPGLHENLPAIPPYGDSFNPSQTIEGGEAFPFTHHETSTVY